MAGKRYLLCLDDARYAFDGCELRTIGGFRDLDGEKMVFSDFEGAVPQVATVETEGKYAHAVLEKELRESGEVESGGRVLVLLRRRQGQRTMELLYITTPADAVVEREIERDVGGHDYLLFPVQKLLSSALVRLKPRRPTAIMLIGERYVDVVVADRRALYGAFRVSALNSAANRELLERNLESALGNLERENNIQIAGFHCDYLLVPEDADYDWVGAVAKGRDVPCEFSPSATIDAEDGRYVTSVLAELRRMKLRESCSPISVINNQRANAALPWVAAAMLACCAVALYMLVERQGEVKRIESRIAALSSSIDARLAGTPPAIPNYRSYLETASRIHYAQSIPTLSQVLGHISKAARHNSTALSGVEAVYDDERVVVTLTGWTEKGEAGNSMAHYNRLITELRQLGYVLSESELNTDARLIDFVTSLEWLIGRGRI